MMQEKLQAFFKNYLPATTAVLLPLLIIALIYISYRGYRNEQLADERYADLVAQLTAQTEAASSTAASLEEAIHVLQDNLSLTAEQSQALGKALGTAKTDLASLQTTTTKIGGTVGDLEKLSQIDEELLKKYSKVSFLNENYVPKQLSEVRNKYLYSERKTQYFLTDASPFLTSMLDTAEAGGVTIYVKSAYRSFNEQDSLKAAYAVTYGEGANAFSADQGYSEHQLGTAVDLITPGLGGELTDAFETTAAFTWLQGNAYRYGFVLSYPKWNAYYIYEPWHWRFVGKSLAKHLHDNGTNFYDMEQRKIDGYLLSLFDQ